jgi:hypothetical protein
VPTHERLGPNDCENPQGCWKPAIQLDEEPAIKIREPNATTPPAPQDNQLMSQHRVLGFKPQLRLEWRGQDGQSEAEQPDHPASLGDSNAASHSDQVFGTHRTGKSFAEHLAGRRLARAFAMLTDPHHLHLAIIDIAFAVGFGDVSLASALPVVISTDPTTPLLVSVPAVSPPAHDSAATWR